METQELIASLALAQEAAVTYTDIDQAQDMLQINWDTRAVTIPKSVTNAGVKNDHLSKKLVFSMDRYVCGVDLANHTFAIHFINVDKWDSKKKNYDDCASGVYPVTNIDLSVDGKVTCEWEITNAATQVVGDVVFALHVFTIVDSAFTYHLGTTPTLLDLLDTVNATEHGKNITPDEIEVYIQKMADLSAEIDAKVAAAEAAATRAEEAAANFEVDDTLSVAGKAADAAATGAKLSQLSSENAELKGDLDTERKRIDVLNDGGLNLKDEVIDTSIKHWLTDHPEATTTVQDGAITEPKIHADFLPYIKNEYVTPEMFGAKGDGVTDDTNAFKQMLESTCAYIVLGCNKTYKLTKYIVFNNKVVYGNNATIYTRVDDEYNIVVTGHGGLLNLNIDSGTGSKHYSLRLRSCTNLIIENCVLSQGIDLNTNNRNVVIRNNTITSYALCTIRELDTDGITENILVENCKSDKTGEDEIVWIDGWYGIVKNVTIENCSIHYADSNVLNVYNISLQSTHSGSKLQNVMFKNCKIYIEKLNGAVVKIMGNVAGVTFDNCIFDIESITTVGLRQFLYIPSSSKNVNQVNNVKFSYCVVNFVETEYEKSGVITAVYPIDYHDVFFDKCDFKGYFYNGFSRCTAVGCRLNKAYNGIIGANIYDSEIEYINRFIYITGANANASYDCKIKDCVANALKSGTYIVAYSGTPTYNSEIIIDGLNVYGDVTGVATSSSSDASITLDIKDSNIKFSKLVGGTTNLLNSIKIKNIWFSNMPSNSNDLGCISVGSVIGLTNNNEHIFAKKITDGNTVDNWILI